MNTNITNDYIKRDKTNQKDKITETKELLLSMTRMVF